MPIQVTATHTRPNRTIPFYSMTPEATAHIKATYIDTGKMTRSDATFSRNKKSKVQIVTWADQAAIDEYNADPIVIAAKEARRTYNQTHKHRSNNVAMAR